MGPTARPVEDRPQSPEEQAALEAIQATEAEAVRKKAFVDDVLRQIQEAEDPQKVRDALAANLLYMLTEQVRQVEAGMSMMTGGGGLGGILKMLR